MRPRLLTDAQIAEIEAIGAHRDACGRRRWKLTYVAALYGVSREIVSNVLIRAGLSGRIRR